MKNILVTGGAGFIGSNFIRHLLATEDHICIINLDALTYAGNQDNLLDIQHDARYTFIHGNICDQELIFFLLQKYSVDTIVHFAAETHVDRSILDSMPFVKTNIQGTAILLEAAKKIWHDKKILPAEKVCFHHISTDEVYGSLDPEDLPFTEASPHRPNSPYAASKAASNDFVRAYFRTYRIPTITTNCSNNYGPFQHPEKLIPLVITNALTGNELPIYGKGDQIRDWLYVADHCEALFKILINGIPGEIYNIGGNNQTTNLEIVSTICKILDEKLPNSKFAPHHQLIRFVADRPGHDYRYAMDITKIQSQIDWTPKHSLQSGLSQTVDWYINNPDWIQKRGF